MNEPDPRKAWLYSFKLESRLTRIGILTQDPLHPLTLPKQIIVEIPLLRIDAELTTILELLKRIPSTQQIEIFLPSPSITVKLLRGKGNYTPTQPQTDLLNRIDSEHRRLCVVSHNLSVSEYPYRLPFLRNFIDQTQQYNKPGTVDITGSARTMPPSRIINNQHH